MATLDSTQGGTHPAAAPKRSDASLFPGDTAPAPLSPASEGEEGSNGDDTYQLPASVAQLRFWHLSRVMPDSAAFNMPATVRIFGPLSAETLEKSMQTIVDRHESLRTRFKDIEGELVQLISARAPFALLITDLQDVPAEGREDALMTLLREDAQRPFSLELGSLLRVRLFRLAADDHVLIVTLHHIISDGWSQGILQRELWTIYEAIRNGRPPDLPPLPIQYSDFAVWQKDWLASEEASAQLAFWMQSLAGPLPVLDFPTDHIPGQRSNLLGSVETLTLPDDLIRRLRRLGQSSHATMFMVMAAAFAIMLERYTDQQKLTIGSPAANRNSQTESIIGPFSGPMALRIDLSGNPTARAAVQNLSEVTMKALDHAGFPFELLLDQLKVRSVRGRNPLFQFYFMYQTAFLQQREIAGLRILPLAGISVGTPFEIQLAIIERNDGVRANLEYDRGLFEPDSIRSILSYYLSVLEEMAANPDRRLSEIALPSLPRRPTQAAESLDSQHELVAPRSAVEAKLAEMWKRLFDLPSVGVCDDFFDLGGHSLMAAKLITMIESEFQVRLDLSNLLVARTIEKLAEMLQNDHSGPRSAIVPLRQLGTKVPLFCVHGGGGHVLSYQELADALPTDQPVYGLSAPELDGALESMSVEQLAALYNREIRRLQPRGPYRLCGYSFGGLVAFQMAAQLIEAGEDVAVLVMLDTGNLDYYRNLPTTDWIRFWTTVAIDRARRYYRRLADRRFDVALSAAFYFVRKNVRLWLWSIAQRVFRVANRPMPRPLRDNLTMFKRVASSYKPRPIKARVILFRAMERDPEYSHNKVLGWDLVAEKGVAVHYVPGDHLSFLRQPYVDKLAGELNKYLV
ncbi:MAG TPA: alpha/beta fold hydrolase [Xanthobacteraceae bacterium]|nr:alpha/beta fold hydrolase [Xanthobacteraceae bacterium]